MTVNEVLKWAEKYADENGKESSAVKILLMHYSGKESHELIMDYNKELDEEITQNFISGVKKYVEENIPVQHITGYEYFYGHKFIVSEDVLIPRFETEELVAHVLATYDEVFSGEEVKVVDVGTGSGAIGITLSLEEEKMNVYCTDISEEALSVAKRNASNLEAKIRFLTGDMLEPVIDNNLKFDILVSNPPYIPKEQFVESLVKDNEPHVALFGGQDGLFFYRIILQNAHKVLKKRNFIAFEHGWDQREEILSLAKEYFPNSVIEQIKDINGKDRITIIINN